MHYTLKKTTQLILEGGNNYIVTVKNHQPRWLAPLETKTQQIQPAARFVDVQKTRGRISGQIVNVLIDTTGIELDGAGLQSLIRVERLGIREGKRQAGATNQLLHQLALDFSC